MKLPRRFNTAKAAIRAGSLLFAVAFVLQMYRNEGAINRAAIGFLYGISIVCMLRALWLRRLTKSAQSESCQQRPVGGDR
jgi:hypothetical protein